MRLQAKTIVVLIAALILFDGVACPQVHTVAGAWLPLKIHWEHAPKTINPKLETAQTRVLYFDDSGKVAVIDCVVNRERGQYMVISNGDGQVISRGKWDGNLPGQVRYQLVSRSVAIKGEQLPGAWQESILKGTRQGHLEFDGNTYERAPSLDSSVRELLRTVPESE